MGNSSKIGDFQLGDQLRVIKGCLNFDNTREVRVSPQKGLAWSYNFCIETGARLPFLDNYCFWNFYDLGVLTEEFDRGTT